MMFKKITAFAVMAVLCFYFSAFGQGNVGVQVTAKGLQVGQRVPDVLITGLHNYKDGNGRAVDSVRLADFRGKLLILDFWATWCSPCVAMIPKMDSLQRVFGDRVVVLPVAYQLAEEVLPFLAKLKELYGGMGFKGPQVMGDVVLRRLFPNTVLPHYVWIGPDGVLRAVTGAEAVSAVNINRMLEDAGARLDTKVDERPIAYDRSRPFLVNGNGGDGSGLLYHSVLTGYTEGLVPNFRNHPPDSLKNEYRVVLQNVPMTWFYQVAYGNGEWLHRGRVRYELRDSGRIWKGGTHNSYQDWKKNGNAFCYELLTSGRLVDDTFRLMQEDLGRIFPGNTAVWKKEWMKCLVLTSTGDHTLLSSKGGPSRSSFGATGAVVENMDFRVLLRRLNNIYFQHLNTPMLDESGFKGSIDLKIAGNLSNVAVLNAGLQKYGLRLVELDRLVEVLVVSDHQ